MKYKLTVLNIWTFSSILIIILYSIFKYEQLSREEGWGIAAMVGLTGICFLGIIADIFLQIFIKNKLMLNLVGLLMAIITTLLILPDL